MALQTKDPLHFMTRISRAICIKEASALYTGDGPRIVLLLGWMAARDIHLAKYAQEYIKRFPAATIILMTARVEILGNPALADSDVKPAIPLILKAIADQKDQPRVHVHLFSNGGSCLLITLYRLFKDVPTSPTFPAHVTIFDSAPWTQYDYTRAVVAILAGIPGGVIKLVISPWIKVICFFAYMRSRFLRSDVFKRWAALHNDKRFVNERKRIYIYSKEDALVPSEDIDRHAKDAQSKGFDVSKELFVGSAHVAHSRVDAERYWSIVQSPWR